MKTKLSYFTLLITLVCLAFATGKYFATTPKEDTSQLEKKASHELHGHDHEEENAIDMPPEQIKDLGIQTKLAGPGELTVIISTRGKITLHPDRLVHVLPKIAGVAKEALKNIGDAVEEDDILAILESREMADIKANYLAAREKLALASALLEREKRLNEKKVSAEQDYLNAKAAYQEAKISVQLAKQKLHAFGINEDEINKLSSEDDTDLKLYEIRSPMKGLVIARHITKGEFIENTTTIYEIADLSTVWIEIGIYPKHLTKVHTGQLVNVFLPDGKKASAKIIYLSPIIQDETITAKAVAELKKPSENWRPGSFVKVNIVTEKITAPIVIPKEAYQEIDGKEFIFIKIPEGFEKRQIQLGLSSSTNVEVVSGLNQGEEYASSNTFLLKADLSKKEAEHTH
jgi:cobalt-zinc-cadmium efflux system membrane fusion protein